MTQAKTITELKEEITALEEELDESRRTVEKMYAVLARINEMEIEYLLDEFPKKEIEEVLNSVKLQTP